MSRHDGWATYLDDPASLELPVRERDALDRIRGVLADSVTWAEPPAGFTARVLELAAAEAADPAGPAGPAAEVPAGPDDADVPDADLRTVSGDLGRPVRPLEAVADPAVAEPAVSGLAVPGPVVSGPAVPGPAIDSADGAEPAVDTPAVSGPAVSGPAVPGPAIDSVDGTDGAEPAVAAPAVPGPARRRAEERWFGRRARWITGATAAAAAAVLAAVLLWPDPLATYPVAGTAAQPGASAVVTLDPKPAGLAISIDITGLPPSTPDTYYAAWLRGPDGTVSVGTFHWKKAANPIDLWSGVEASRYPTFFITRQREGEPPTPSSEVVLEGRVG